MTRGKLVFPDRWVGNSSYAFDRPETSAWGDWNGFLYSGGILNRFLFLVVGERHMLI
jgi:hypothetical protein